MNIASEENLAAGNARIVGGSGPDPNGWKAQVFVTIDASESSSSRNCSGTLIDYKTVLVSGYCKISFIFL